MIFHTCMYKYQLGGEELEWGVSKGVMLLTSFSCGITLSIPNIDFFFPENKNEVESATLKNCCFMFHTVDLDIPAVNLYIFSFYSIEALLVKIESAPSINRHREGTHLGRGLRQPHSLHACRNCRFRSLT